MTTNDRIVYWLRRAANQPSDSVLVGGDLLIDAAEAIERLSRMITSEHGKRRMVVMPEETVSRLGDPERYGDLTDTDISELVAACRRSLMIIPIDIQQQEKTP
jgi:hypothetical protein